MTLTHFLMLLAIGVSAAVALLISYQQRRQMRQIELYKLDSSVGLTPPPTALTRFIKSKWDVVLGFGGPTINLVLELSSSAPITRLSVFVISLSVALLLTNVVMAVTFRLVERMAASQAQLGAFVSALQDAVKDHVELTGISVRVLDELTDLVKPPSTGA